MYEEVDGGPRWKADADEFGTFICAPLLSDLSPESDTADRPLDAADRAVLDVDTAEDFAQEFEDDGTEEDGEAA